MHLASYPASLPHTVRGRKEPGEHWGVQTVDFGAWNLACLMNHINSDIAEGNGLASQRYQALYSLKKSLGMRLYLHDYHSLEHHWNPHWNWLVKKTCPYRNKYLSCQFLLGTASLTAAFHWMLWMGRECISIVAITAQVARTEWCTEHGQITTGNLFPKLPVGMSWSQWVSWPTVPLGERNLSWSINSGGPSHSRKLSCWLLRTLAPKLDPSRSHSPGEKVCFQPLSFVESH